MAETRDLGATDGPMLIFGGPYGNLQATQALLAAAAAPAGAASVAAANKAANKRKAIFRDKAAAPGYRASTGRFIPPDGGHDHHPAPCPARR